MSTLTTETSTIRSSETTFINQFLAYSPLASAVFDTEMRYLAVNQKWVETYNLHGRELLGHSHYDIFPEIGERWKTLHRRTLNGEVIQQDVDVFPRADGNLDFVNYEMHPWHQPDGQVGGLIMYTAVVTDQVRASQITKRRESRFQAMYEVLAAKGQSVTEQLTALLKVGVDFLTLDLGIISQIEGDEYTVLYCYDRNGGLQPGAKFILGQTYCAITVDASGVTMIEHMGKSEFKGHPCYQAFGLETYIGIQLMVNDKPFGTLNFTSADPRNVPFDETDRDFFLLMAQLISGILEREAARQELEQQKNYLRQVIDAAPAMIFVKNYEGQFEVVNQATANIYQTTPMNLMGKTDADFNPNVDEVQAFLEADKKVMKAGQPFTIEEPVSNAKGETRWFRTTKVPIYDTNQQSNKLVGVAVDITERRQAEENLKQVNEQLSLILENLPLVSYTLSLKTGAQPFHASYVGASIQTITGYTVEDFAAKPDLWLDNLHPDDQASILGSMTKVMQQDMNQYEYRWKHADGQYRWILDVQRLVRDTEGNPHYIAGTWLDITERKQAEEALIVTEERFQLALQGADLGLWDWDVQTGRVTFNERWAEMVGYTLSEIEPNVSVWEKLVLPEDMPHITEVLTAHLEGRTPFYETEHRMVAKNGDIKWILDKGRVFERTPDGKPLRAIGTHLDITERKRLEAEREVLFKQTENQYQLSRTLATVRSNQEFTQTIRQTLPGTSCDGLAMFSVELDKNGQPDWAELVAAQTNNLPMGTRYKIADMPFAHFWFKNQQEPQLVEDVATDSRIDNISRVIFSGLGICSVAIVPLNVAGRWVGVLSFTWNTPHTFTEQEIAFYRALPSLAAPVADNLHLLKELQKTVQDLKVANRLAKENARLKSEFLATMSHELRTPMNAIEGFTSIMLSNMGVELPPQGRKMLERVSLNSKRLLQLINDFLDLSRIESGRMELANMPMTPAALADKWRDALVVLAENKKLAFEVTVDPSLPTTLYGDEESLSKIVINLLSNAIKFTHQGKVALDLQNRGKEWAILVTDTGIGIPPHAREYIFDEFRQLDQSSKRLYGGTGLGLAIVQKLLRAMGGTVTVDSEVGKGSTFTVLLPLSTAAEQTIQGG